MVKSIPAAGSLITAFNKIIIIGTKFHLQRFNKADDFFIVWGNLYLSKNCLLYTSRCVYETAPILFIAEAPGKNEDRDGIPFTGRSGELFDRLLSEIGMKREEIYLTNIVKCHPPNNRDPKQEEQESCIPYLKYETVLLRPKMIVCLGRIAAQRIIRPDYRITREHGTFLERKGVWLTGVFHPSAALRDETKLPLMQEDFRKIKEKLDTCV